MVMQLLLVVLVLSEALTLPLTQTLSSMYSDVLVNDEHVETVLGDQFMSQTHSYTLPNSALRKGTIYKGSSHRLRRAVKGMLAGKPAKIAIIGGSDSSAAAGNVTSSPMHWTSMLGTWARGAFKNVTVKNSMQPGCSSSYMVMCMDFILDTDVDIVFSDHLMIDQYSDVIQYNPQTMAHERLARRVLGMPSRPAMVMMHMGGHGSNQEPSSPAWQPFAKTLEDVYGSIAQYYDIQWLSFRSATHRLARTKKAANIISMNPEELKHRVLADLAVWLLQQTAIDLVMRPWEHADVEQLQEPLPPPMVPGNEVPSSVMCIQGERFLQLNISHPGWEFDVAGSSEQLHTVREGDSIAIGGGSALVPTSGLVSSTPGSTLSFHLDTTRTNLYTKMGRDGSNDRVIVSIGYVKSSNEAMGKVLVECQEGCTCAVQVLDGQYKSDDMAQTHQEAHARTYVAVLEVSQHRECIIRVTVNPESRGKFKVVSLTVSDSANPVPSSMQHVKAGPWPV